MQLGGRLRIRSPVVRHSADIRFGSKADIDARSMSAFPPIPDISRTSRNVRFVPEADIAHLTYSIASSARESKNLIHKSSGAPKTLTQVRPVAHQPTIFGIVAKPEHRRQPLCHGEQRDSLPSVEEHEIL